MRPAVCALTGTRAEFGLLRPVLEKLRAREDIDLRLVVTGAHLAPGGTLAQVEESGLPIDRRVDISGEENTPLGTALTTGRAMELFARYFHERPPACLLVLGDRFEVFAAAAAAAVLGVPIAHISGGDVTAGAQDEFFRHAVTKMAKLHFPSCPASARRLVRMGEEPWRVVMAGGLGDENIRTTPKMTREELAESLSFDPGPGFLLATLHPETAAGGTPPEALAGALTRALDSFPDRGLLFTGANADAGGDAINAAAARYCAGRKNALFVPSLGARRYLSAMALCGAVVGNSSSGVVETPSLGAPAVNIGSRQQGREICANVLCCPPLAEKIAQALEKALSPAFGEGAGKVRSPYYGGDTSGEIADTLCYWLQEGLFAEEKRFYEGED